MDDIKNWFYLGGGGATLFIVGRWLVPILGRTLDNVLASTKAAGETLANVIAERDHWKAEADAQRARADALMDMKAQFELVKYQLEQAAEQVAQLRAEVRALKEQQNARNN